MPKIKLTGTEKCLLEVFNDFRFSIFEKSEVLMSYESEISDEAFMFLWDRMHLIELLKNRRLK